MPKELSAGYSEGTERKCRDFADFQRLHMGLTRIVMGRNEWADGVYHYIDLNAGPGRVNGMDGSPLLFLANAAAARGRWRAWFCEQDEASAALLRAEAGFASDTEQGRVEIMEMDHRLALPLILPHLRPAARGQRSLGLAYADPNGLPTAEIESLRLLRFGAPKLDILLHLSATTIKRCKSVFGYPSLVERLALLGKKRVLIRRPVADYQWTFALLTDWQRYPDWTARGFYDSTSDTGIAILERLNLSATEQRRKQLELW